MKFCKHCAHYSPGFVGDGGSLLPGFLMVLPARCNGNPEPTINLVTGEFNTYAGACVDMRLDGTKCGTSAVWFKPATLDGRLAMLEDAIVIDEDIDQAERDLIEIIEMIQRDYRKQIEPYLKQLATLRSLRPAPPIMIDASVWRDLHIAKVANERPTN